MEQKNFWTKIEGACCIIVAWITALVKLVLKYVVGTYSNVENPSGKSDEFQDDRIHIRTISL